MDSTKYIECKKCGGFIEVRKKWGYCDECDEIIEVEL